MYATGVCFLGDQQAQRENSIDKQVGNRIRMQRMMLNMSLANVAKEVGLTLQQIQKYEMGITRIGASTLEHIAHTLRVPVGFFFEDVSTDEPSRMPTRKTAPTVDINEFMATKEGLALAKAFRRISNEKIRQQIVSLVADLGQSREAAD
jgi:transcriptional regulator with XRE-family HTH domain